MKLYVVQYYIPFYDPINHDVLPIMLPQFYLIPSITEK